MIKLTQYWESVIKKKKRLAEFNKLQVKNDCRFIIKTKLVLL